MEASAAPVLQESQVATGVESFAGGRTDPAAFRASIEAVRVAQQTARARARRQTIGARLIAVVVLGTAGIVAWNFSSRRSHRPRETVAAPTVAPVPAIAPAVPAEPVAAAPVAAAIPVSIGPDDVAACEGAFVEHRWPSVATSCAAAFKASPVDSAIAMRVAQAEHRLGHVAIAGEWARNAIALDDSIAEAFVILARAEAQAGHPQATSTAYRRYLALAPHGWHAAEARRALPR
jgi:hypothetical protein